MARRREPEYRVEELHSVAREGHIIDVDAATSARMGNIRQHGTTPELLVRSAVRALGHRYRTTNRDLPGNPDLANRRRRWAIFVHGCFWHRHPGCRLTTTPTRNRQFWLDKFDRNERRDAAAIVALRASGYAVMVVWECETRDVARLVSQIDTWFARAVVR